MRRSPFKRGDVVAYRAFFLRSICDYSHAAASRRGVVVNAQPADLGDQFVQVLWQDREDPSFVNVGNVMLASRLALEPA